MKINLESIKEEFPTLKHFIARLTEDVIQEFIDRHPEDVEYEHIKDIYSNESVYKGFSYFWTTIAFGESINNYVVDIPEDLCECVCFWLGNLYLEDTEYLVDKLEMIYEPIYLDDVLYEFYKLIEDEVIINF